MNTKKTKAMTNNKQQTAVEFYLDKIFDIIGDAILDKLSIEQINKIHDLSIQAKEMEKEQTEQAKLDAKEIIIIKHTEHGGGEQ
jgi:hypothetical protein